MQFRWSIIKSSLIFMLMVGVLYVFILLLFLCMTVIGKEIYFCTEMLIVHRI